MTTVNDVFEFIDTLTEERQLDSIQTALNDRRKTLRARRAASVQIGDLVEIANITPKTLSGLTGTVQSIKGKYATVLLDAKSTTKLRFSRIRQSRLVASTAENHPLDGIPLSCCVPQAV